MLRVIECSFRDHWRSNGRTADNGHMAAALLLLISNIFMTFAWYGHLKYKSAPMWIAILVSWGIAFFEYCFQVPANRIGHGQFTATQLKIMQEAITLIVFIVFAKLYFAGEPIRWNYLVGMALIFIAVFVVFYEWK
jgi:uncharacterized protein